jgi:predicted phosphohydrolase
MKLVWCSDTHFNFVSRLDIPSIISDFESRGDVVVYTGDIDDGRGLRNAISCIGGGEKPSYYVLGNHDYYHSSWSYVDSMCKNEQFKAVSVENAGPIKLTDSTVMVGVGGWADGRAGNFLKSCVAVADHEFIRELSGYRHNSKEILGLVRDRADRHQEILKGQIEKAIEMNAKNIVILSHAPIFKETNLAPDGKLSNGDWLPHFAWVGPRDMIVKYADKNQGINFVCLAGHTHTRCNKIFRNRKNLSVFVSGARYRSPVVSEVFDID